MKINFKLLAATAIFSISGTQVWAASTFTTITDKSAIAEITAEFKSALSRYGINSDLKCNNVVQLNNDEIRQDYSYGAVCTILKSNASGLMCNDAMIGKFTFGGSNALTIEGVSRFIEFNCPPGG